MAFFEDFAVGQTRAFGRYEVTREEVIAFASRYDPQPFHLDDAAAARTHFGRVAASGWHTTAMAMAMAVADMGDDDGSLGGVGVDNLRWLKPVHPGDTLRCESEVLTVEPSSTRPIGRVRTRTTVFNQHGEPVLRFEPLAMWARREG